MPKLSKADNRAKISANESRRRKELAFDEIQGAEKDGSMIARFGRRWTRHGRLEAKVRLFGRRLHFARASSS
jgi:hypothetical protein